MHSQLWLQFTHSEVTSWVQFAPLVPPVQLLLLETGFQPVQMSMQWKVIGPLWFFRGSRGYVTFIFTSPATATAVGSTFSATGLLQAILLF